MEVLAEWLFPAREVFLVNSRHGAFVRDRLPPVSADTSGVSHDDQDQPSQSGHLTLFSTIIINPKVLAKAIFFEVPSSQATRRCDCSNHTIRPSASAAISSA